VLRRDVQRRVAVVITGADARPALQQQQRQRLRRCAVLVMLAGAVQGGLPRVVDGVDLV
jgi:hypothetical protein